MQKKRTVQKHFELSVYENEVLKALVDKTGFSTESEVLRHLIMGAQLMQSPGKEFYQAVKEIRMIGININQIAHMANAKGVIDAEALYVYKNELDMKLAEIRKIVLLPQKIRDLKTIIKEMEFMVWDTEEEQRKCWKIMDELAELLKKKEGKDGNN